jgi:hypothetical protein
MFLPNGDSFTGEWRRGLIGGTSLCVWRQWLCWLCSAGCCPAGDRLTAVEQCSSW